MTISYARTCQFTVFPPTALQPHIRWIDEFVCQNLTVVIVNFVHLHEVCRINELFAEWRVIYGITQSLDLRAPRAGVLSVSANDKLPVVLIGHGCEFHCGTATGQLKSTMPNVRVQWWWFLNCTAKTKYLYLLNVFNSSASFSSLSAIDLSAALPLVVM